MVSDRYKRILIAMLLMAVGVASRSDAARIKDLAAVKGVRSNQLIGYGLVVGLNGTGDGFNTLFTVQSIASMLKKMGVLIPPADLKRMKVKNVAAVMVVANLPPFARSGSRLDVLISSMGDAATLQGGTLLMTPLMGADGAVYAVAQGPVSIGGFTAEGQAEKVQKNHPTVGRIASGALIEKEITTSFSDKHEILLALGEPDFSTANNVVTVINRHFGKPLASPLDSGTVRIQVPPERQAATVAFMADIENLSVVVQGRAKIILDERTGTIVMGSDVKVSTVAISHGNLHIRIKEQAQVSQPGPFSKGETVVIPETSATVEEDDSDLVMVKQNVTIDELVLGLNALGVTPRDLISILQAIKAAGALQAELEFI